MAALHSSLPTTSMLFLLLISSSSLLLLERSFVHAFTVHHQPAAVSTDGFSRAAGRHPMFSSLVHDSTALRMGSSSTTVDPDFVSAAAASAKVLTLDDDEVLLGQVLESKSDAPVILSCLSHFGDFNAWELTQQYVVAMKEGGKLADTSANLVLVGIGSVASANQFAKDLGLQELMESGKLTLVADSEGAVTSALGCYKGWLSVDPVHRERYPQSDVSPYIKLLGMIFGFGSPGTIGNVLYGYVGDTTGSKGVDGRSWVVDSLLQGSSQGRFPNLTPAAFEDVPISSSLRPFELATLRLQTGLHIVSNWGKLVPQGKSPLVGDLLTRMGGTFVLDRNGKCQWSYFDQGILTYADVDEVYQVINAVEGGDPYVPWTSEQKAALNRERQALLVQQVETQKEAEREAENARRAKEREEELARQALERDEELARQAEEKEAEIQALEREAELARQAEIQARLELQAEKEQSTPEAASKSVFFARPVSNEPEEDDDSIFSLEDEDKAPENEEVVYSEESFLNELEQAIMEELDEETSQALEEEFEREEIEDEALEAYSPDTLVQDTEDIQSEQQRRLEEAMQAKELFQRALLQASFKYAATARVLPMETRTTGSEKELFQRELLKARLRYAAAASARALKSMLSPTATATVERPSSPEVVATDDDDDGMSLVNSTTDGGDSPADGDATEPSFSTELESFNGAPNQNAVPAEERKEMFQRALLKAQLQYKS